MGFRYEDPSNMEYELRLLHEGVRPTTSRAGRFGVHEEVDPVAEDSRLGIHAVHET